MMAALRSSSDNSSNLCHLSFGVCWRFSHSSWDSPGSWYGKWLLIDILGIILLKFFCFNSAVAPVEEEEALPCYCQLRMEVKTPLIVSTVTIGRRVFYSFGFPVRPSDNTLAGWLRHLLTMWGVWKNRLPACLCWHEWEWDHTFFFDGCLAALERSYC